MAIETVGIIGGGVMGSGIGQALAVGGCRVTVRDLNEELLAKSKATIVDGRYGLNRGVERGKTSQEDADAALARLSWTTDIAAIKDVDLVIEAVPEDLDLKKKVFTELDANRQGGRDLRLEHVRPRDLGHRTRRCRRRGGRSSSACTSSARRRS